LAEFFLLALSRPSFAAGERRASNRRTGVVMVLIKKIDVPKHFAARRAMRLVAARQAMQPHPIAAAGVKPVRAKENAVKSIEISSLEHSSSLLIVPPKA